MTREALHRVLRSELLELRRQDGGLPLGEGGSTEVEPTAVAALALDDDAARRWLRRRQRADGGFDEIDGRGAWPSTSAVAALALGRSEAADRALRHAIEHRSLPLPNAPDPERRAAWGWTPDARSLTEPTARVVLAAKVLGHGDPGVRAEGVKLLRERQCADGGWNFGNASVFDVDLRSYAQTTAFALLALQGEDTALVEPGLAALPPLWRAERGTLTLAQAALAFRLHARDGEARASTDALAEVVDRGAMPGRTIALAWAVLATAPDPDLDRLRAS